MTDLPGEEKSEKKEVKNKKVEFLVLSPSFNNINWCEKSLLSLFSQTFKEWTLCYIDDFSSDGTYEKVKELIEKHKMGEKCHLVRNSSRKGAMENIYVTLSNCPPHKVVVMLDGDDWLAHENVLKRVAKEYEDPGCWVTYGNYTTFPLAGEEWRVCAPLPPVVCEMRTFRRYFWVTSHLKSFYATLFQKIEKEDLLCEGEFFTTTSDLAFMFPILEMASKGHIRFIDEILYIYNIKNPLSDFAVYGELQRIMDKYIRMKPSYEALEELFPREKE